MTSVTVMDSGFGWYISFNAQKRESTELIVVVVDFCFDLIWWILINCVAFVKEMKLMTLLSVKTWTDVIWDMYYVVGACKWLSLVSGDLSIFNHEWSFQFYYMFVITLKFLNILRGCHVHFWAVGIVVRVNSLYCRKMEDSEGRAERAKRLNQVFSLRRYAFNTTGTPLCDSEELHRSELKW